MGFLDEIFSDLREVAEEIQGIKDDFVSSIIDPSGELNKTVQEIAGQITGTAQQPSAPVDPASATTHIPVSTPQDDTNQTN